MDAAYSLAKNLVTVNYDDIPHEVVEVTKKQILDILGVALGGSSRPGVREAWCSASGIKRPHPMQPR